MCIAATLRVSYRHVHVCSFKAVAFALHIGLYEITLLGNFPTACRLSLFKIKRENKHRKTTFEYSWLCWRQLKTELGVALVRVSIGATKHHKQATWEGKGLFCLGSHIIVHHWRKSGQELKQGRNLEAGADAEAMEECCLLVCSSWLVQPAFFIEATTTSPGMAPPTMGWALPHQSLIKKMPYRLAHIPISLRLFLCWGSLFSDDNSLWQVVRKIPSPIDPLSTWDTNMSRLSHNLSLLIHP